MKVLNCNNKEFLIGHFQGKSSTSYIPLINTLKEKRVSIPENVQIVTTASGNLAEPMLITQLNNAGIPFINKAACSRKWDNVKKIKYIREGLDDVTSEYTLVLDSTDVLLVKDLTDIVARFAGYGKKIIFGATKSNYPNVFIDAVNDRDFRGEFKYLNAGTCFGKTEDLKGFYKKADYLVWEDELDNPKRSEQFIIRYAFAEDTESVDFDYKCEIFQTFGGTVGRLIDDDTLIIE